MSLYTQGGRNSGIVDEIVDVNGRALTSSAQTSANNAQSTADSATATANAATSDKLQHLAASQSTFFGTTSSPQYTTLMTVSQNSQGVVIALCSGTYFSGTISSAITYLRLVDGNGNIISNEITLGNGGTGANLQAGWALCGASTTGSAALQGRSGGGTTQNISATLVCVGGTTT